MKRVIVDQIEIARDGHIQIRLKKQIIDGAETFDLGYHRTIVEVGGNVDAQVATLNAHLAQMGFPAIQAEEIADVKKYAAIAFTPQKITAYRDRLKAAENELAQQTSK